MDAAQIAASLLPGSTIRDISTGTNRVFRAVEEDGRTSIIKVYASAARERRERHALNALAGTPGVPQIIDRGTVDEVPWVQLIDSGIWTLATLPENHAVARKAGAVLRAVHDVTGALITNLEAGMNHEWVASHYEATINRLERYRRRLGLSPALLQRALAAPPPRGGKARPAHTNPRPSKFAVNDHGDATLIDWEWGTLAPPEWDLSLAIWRLSLEVSQAAADALHSGYAATLPEERLRPWIAFHAAMWMLDAAERREGRLADLTYLVTTLEQSIG